MNLLGEVVRAVGLEASVDPLPYSVEREMVQAGSSDDQVPVWLHKGHPWNKVQMVIASRWECKVLNSKTSSSNAYNL